MFKWERSVSRSETALICPRDIRKVLLQRREEFGFQGRDVDAEMGETEEDGVYHRRSLWAEWEASWLFNFHFDLDY